MISGLIVAHNEEALIEGALRSLSFCDEIVVVLDKCTDGTKAIAQKYASTLIEGDWEIEGERRNLGIDACSHKWIIELDADERVTPELEVELKAMLPNSPDGYYLVPIDNYVGDHLVKHGWAGSFGTTRAKKVFSKGAKLWGNQRVHPKLTLNGEEMALKSPITHYIDTDVNDMIDRMQRYSDAAAADMAVTGIPPFRKTLRKALTRFYKSYLGRKGYKEGKYGFMLALMAALFMIFTHLKAELEHGKKED